LIVTRGILVSDFDGTLTKYDFYDLVCKEFPEISTAGYWQQYEAGKLTHFEALRSIFALIRTDEAKLVKIVDSMEIEPKAAISVSALKNKGWEVIVASAGCDWYIKRLLKGAGVSMTLYANPGEFYPDKGLLMSLPERTPFFSNELGVNKVALVRDALSKAQRVAFAGDGRPDLAAALLVPPDMRFAKSWLARRLEEINEGFHPFERWSDVADQLVKGDQL